MIEAAESGYVDVGKILSEPEREAHFALRDRKIDIHRDALRALITETYRGKFDGGPGPRPEKMTEYNDSSEQAGKVVAVVNEMQYLHYEPKPYGTFAISGILTDYIPEGMDKSAVSPSIEIQATRVRTKMSGDKEGNPTGPYQLALQGTFNRQPMFPEHAQMLVDRYLGLMKERQQIMENPTTATAPQAERPRLLPRVTLFRGRRAKP